MYLNKEGKKIAVIGSRTMTDKKAVYEFLDRNREKVKMIVSGGAQGPDTFAEEWAEERGFPLLKCNARWHEADGSFNRGAGFARNRVIVSHADIVVAFWDGESKGTKNSIDTAKELGKPVKIIQFDPKTQPPKPEPPIVIPVKKDAVTGRLILPIDDIIKVIKLARGVLDFIKEQDLMELEAEFVQAEGDIFRTPPEMEPIIKAAEPKLQEELAKPLDLTPTVPEAEVPETL